MFGLFVPFFVVVCSVILIVRLRFFLFTSFPRIFLFAYRSLGRVDARRSLFLALAGTLGVGNIVGVAVGIIVGGKGSVFWLVLSSLFSMILKYSEASLTAQNSGDSRYGMISLIKNSYPVFGNFASCIYAFLCMLLSFFMGAMLQSSSVCMSVFEITGVSRYFIGIVLCILVFVAISLKKFGIIRIVSWLVPIASILYLALCLFSIFKGIYRLPKVIADIMRSAFSVSSIGGGLCGFALSSGIKEGFSRGLLSNEAGAGTSTLAHATNSACSPAEVGVLGMAEVIVDTVVFCPMTALAVLVNVSDISSYSSGISLIMDSLGGAFYGSGIVLSVCIFVFAYATVICWFYYGILSVDYVFGRGKVFFSVMYLIAVMLGSVVGDFVTVAITDVILLLLTISTSITLIKRSGTLIELSERDGLIKTRLKCQAKPSLHPRI